MQNQQPGDPYRQASYLKKLQEIKTIFLTDLDGTHATRDSSLQELGDRAAVRKLIDASGFVAGAVTARTPALTMSSSTYAASCRLGFKEAEPHCGIDPAGKRIYVPPEELPHFAHSQDWDVVAGFGSGIFPRNGDGYLIDHEFDNLLNYDYAKARPAESSSWGSLQRLDLERPLPWRLAALSFLRQVWPQAREHFSPLEFSKNYRDGVTDVMPLPYRIQLHFHGAEGLVQLRKLRETLRRKKYDNDPVALRMAVVDESKLVDGEWRYVLYLVPWVARKERMINHLVERSAAAAELRPESLRLFYAGDTPTDIRAGFWAGGYVPLTFLLATGSPLAPYVAERREFYGEEPIDFSRLKPTEEAGVYHYKVRTRRWRNKVVIGDERYPGTTPPGSVRAFLEEFAN